MKAERWLSAGVRLVWLVFPEARVAEVLRGQGTAEVLSVEDNLSGEDVLPGFVLPVEALFS
jgi:Uma2 family endonuclease